MGSEWTTVGRAARQAVHLMSCPPTAPPLPAQNHIDTITDEEAKMVKLMIPGGPEHRRQAPVEKVSLVALG